MKKQIKDQNKSPSDRGKVSKKNDFAVDYKSGDFERALKMHGIYLFGKRKAGDDSSIDLLAGDTWQEVLNAHAYIEEPSDREIELFQIIQKEIEGEKSRTIDFSLIHAEPNIDAGVLLICFEILVKHGQPSDALSLIFEAKSPKMHSQFSKYVLSKRISPKHLDSLSDEIKRRIDLNKIVELATPKDLSAIAKHAETFFEIASEKLKPETLALLIAMESRIANDGSKLIQKTLARNCFLVVEKNEGYWDKAFQIISEQNQLALLASFIGRREKYLPTNVSRQLEMIKTAANLKLDAVVVNEKSWNGLNIGHFARVGTLVKKSDFVGDYLTIARKLTSDALQKLSLGGFLQIVDSFPEFKKVYEHGVLRDQILDSVVKKRGLSSEIVKNISNNLIAQAVDVSQQRGSIQLTKMEEEIASLNARLSERGIELDLLTKEIETLKERLRNAGKSELIARSDQLRQAQLQALRGLCELFEEVRIHIAAQETQFAKSGEILSESGLRILKNFGISVLGRESERLKIDHNLFNTSGSTSMTDGLVVTPAYFVNLESGVEVLIRGTMLVS
jgi:hypothetical protein